LSKRKTGSSPAIFATRINDFGGGLRHVSFVLPIKPMLDRKWVLKSKRTNAYHEILC